MEKKQHHSDQPIDDEIDLLELFNKYFKPYWKTYLKSAFLFAFLFTAFSYSITPKYVASASLQVNTGETTSSSNRLGGLASLAGLSMGARGGSDVLFNIKYLQSREVAEAFIEKEDLRKKLFYKLLNEDGQFEQKKKKGLLSFLRSSEAKGPKLEDEDILHEPGPSKWQTYKRFKSVFLVSVNEKEMSASVSVKWDNRLQAKRWANAYVEFINDLLRRKTIHESNLKIDYLKSQVSQNSSIEVQQSIYSLIENELKKITVAESSDQYAFKIIQRAFLPEIKDSPKRKRFLVVGWFFGLLITFVFTWRRVSSL